MCIRDRDPADHNHLLIDDKVAHVVREIFDLALAGNGIAKIRKHINKQHILRPAAYAAEQGATGYELSLIHICGVRCRSPPLHLDFEHFKNSDGRYLQ